MPAYASPSSFAVEDDGGSVASVTSLASKESQVRGDRFSLDTNQAGNAKFLPFLWASVFCHDRLPVNRQRSRRVFD